MHLISNKKSDMIIVNVNNYNTMIARGGKLDHVGTNLLDTCTSKISASITLLWYLYVSIS